MIYSYLEIKMKLNFIDEKGNVCNSIPTAWKQKGGKRDMKLVLKKIVFMRK